MNPICTPLQTIVVGKCDNNIGGLKTSIYVFPTSGRKTYSLDAATYTVDTLSYEDDATPTPAPILPISISFDKNTANFGESGAGTIETANFTNTVTMSITINNRQYTKSKAISILGANGLRELDIVVSQSNGTNWFIPNAVLTQTDSTSGTMRSDGSNYVLTFTADLSELLYGIEDADVLTLITTGSI